MFAYKNLIVISFALMLLSGFLHGFVNCYEDAFFVWISNISGWAGAFLFGYNAPGFLRRNWWYYGLSFTAMAGFWSLGAAFYWLSFGLLFDH